jgi:hypothetical protein
MADEYALVSASNRATVVVDLIGFAARGPDDSEAEVDFGDPERQATRSEAPTADGGSVQDRNDRFRWIVVPIAIKLEQVSPSTAAGLEAKWAAIMAAVDAVPPAWLRSKFAGSSQSLYWETTVASKAVRTHNAVQWDAGHLIGKLVLEVQPHPRDVSGAVITGAF